MIDGESSKAVFRKCWSGDMTAVRFDSDAAEHSIIRLSETAEFRCFRVNLTQRLQHLSSHLKTDGLHERLITGLLIRP